MKKITIALLAVLAMGALIMLSGCGGSDSGSDSDKAETMKKDSSANPAGESSV